MLYTVKETAALANVTVKTLHHYHKVGLLVPCEISAAGYRLYGQQELERLQQILFYRELDFSLKDIQAAMSEDVDRVAVLTRQRRLLTARLKRLERLVQTLDDSLSYAGRDEPMDKEELFKGFSAAEWQDALAEQSDYLKGKYGFDLIGENPIQADAMNVMAREAIYFQTHLAQALRDGLYVQDERVQALLSEHVAFLNAHGHAVDAAGFAKQVRFLVGDEFHRKMMESDQVGLAYYFLAAAEAFAAK
jgi:DNA-binding transcriptional MerR regulator